MLIRLGMRCWTNNTGDIPMYKNEFIEEMVEKLRKEGYSYHFDTDKFIAGADVREVLKIVVDSLGEVMGERDG